jgi:hypothetical protein
MMAQRVEQDRGDEWCRFMGRQHSQKWENGWAEAAALVVECLL